MIKQEDTDRKENRHDNMHIQYKDCVVLYALKLYTSVHKQTDTHKHSHTYTHTHRHLLTHSHIPTQKQSLEIWCHIFVSTSE